MRAPTLPPPAAPKVPRKRRKSLLLSFLGFSFAAFVVLFMGASTVIGVIVWRASKDLPDYESLAKYEPPVMTCLEVSTQDSLAASLAAASTSSVGPVPQS